MAQEVLKELSRLQRELKAPKNLWNKFGGYAYRNAEGILEAVKQILSPGYAVLLNDEIVAIGERYYIRATATLTNGEESVSVNANAREDEDKKGMDGAQITGACSSYARKYALNGLFAIDDNKDSDDDSLSPKNPENQKPADYKKARNNKEPSVILTSATVEKSDKLPPAQQTEAKKNPVEVFLLTAMAGLRKVRGISAKENNELFAKQHEALIAANLAPNKSLKEYTMDEATALIDAMYKNFTPTGTELKT